MENNKFRYSTKDTILFYQEEIFTLEEIENGTAYTWIKKNDLTESKINRDQYTGIYDDSKEIEELYENDIVEVFIYYDFIVDSISIIGVIEYNEEECCYYIDFPKWGMSKPLSCFTGNGIIKKGNYYNDFKLLELEEEEK